MNISLSTDDCVEIYYALDYDEDLQDKLGADGKCLADGSFVPSESELRECIDAVGIKLNKLRDDFYGDDEETETWTMHMEEILAKLEAAL